MRNNARNHLIFSILVLIALCGAYYTCLSLVSVESARVAVLQTSADAKSEDSARIAQAKSTLTMLATEESDVNGHFVATANIVPYLESLQATGKALSTKVQVVSVAADKTPPSGHLTLSLSIVGPFDAVLRTLGSYENAPTDTSLTSLTLDTTGLSGSSTPTWSAATVLSVGITGAKTSTQ
jgi:hypothetical protein